MADGDANLILKGFDSYEVSLGDALRGERATLGKSLLDVERDLKIRAIYIAAIEECDINAFPNTGFVAGYVRSYARYLNLDPDPTFEAFCREANFKGTDVTTFQQNPKSKGNKVKITKSKLTQPNSISDKWEPGAVGVVANSTINAANLLNSVGPFFVLAILIISLGYGGWKIFENIQRIELVAIEQSPIVQNSPFSSFSISEEPGSGSGVNPDIMALYSDQVTESSFSNPRDGKIADIDSSVIGFYVQNSDQQSNFGRLSSEQDSSKVNLPEFKVLGLGSDEPLNYKKTVNDSSDLGGSVGDSNSLELPSFNYKLPEFSLFSYGPTWIKLESVLSDKSFEVIMDSEVPFAIGDKWHFGSLRAGNANNLYIIINGAAYGPLGTSSVVKNVEISESSALLLFKYDLAVTSLFNEKFGTEENLMNFSKKLAELEE